MQGILFLGNKMQDATSQDLDPMSREDTPQSWSGEDTPGSYIRKDSWHASILYQERTVDTPQSYVRRGQWTHLNLGQERTVNNIQIRRGHLDPVSWERNISIPNNNNNGDQDSKPPRYSKEGKRWRWLFEVWRKFVGNKPGGRVEMSTK